MTQTDTTCRCPSCHSGRLSVVERDGALLLVCSDSCRPMRLAIGGRGGERWAGVLGTPAGLRVVAVGREGTVWDAVLRERRAGQCIVVAPSPRVAADNGAKTAGTRQAT
jgi:hypothetical protein